jgi:dTMP kinase
MKKAKYIVIEGTEGVGKSTQTTSLVKMLRDQGNTVLETKEPGSPHNLTTQKLRGFMLDAEYARDMEGAARELISQTIRAIHIKEVIIPAIEAYDYIIQDRGMLSALSYGEACGNEIEMLKVFNKYAIGSFNNGDISTAYDKIIILTGDSKKGLERATSSKKEFAAGDAIEQKGASFIEKVSQNFIKFQSIFKNVVFINIDGKSIEEVFQEMIKNLP